MAIHSLPSTSSNTLDFCSTSASSDQSLDGSISMHGRTNRRSDRIAFRDGPLTDKPEEVAVVYNDSDGELLVPKQEVLDDDDALAPFNGLQNLHDDSTSDTSPVERQVSRPKIKSRKNSVKTSKLDEVCSTTPSKVPKPRSKTGCKTCRKRKKKCDEAKPSCQNCVKNGVLCEGYPIRTYWKSGKQRTETHPPSIPVNPPIVLGVETEIDSHFFDHFFSNVSHKLSCHNGPSNPFVTLLMPMAVHHLGLMHSILALSGTHLMSASKDQAARFEPRRLYHFQHAISKLRESILQHTTRGSRSLPDDPTVASTLVMCLESICAGKTNGEYRAHLDGAGELVKRHMLYINSEPSQASAFSRFLLEFFLYHDVLRHMTIVDRRPSFIADFDLPRFMNPKECGSLIGVIDGLFSLIGKITTLRNKLRDLGIAGQSVADGTVYEVISEAVHIDRALRDWQPSQPAGHPHYVGAMVYKQCVHIYLYRTTYPSQPLPAFKHAVDGGLELLAQIPEGGGAESILLMPIFMLGCAAFEENQRPRVKAHFEAMQRWGDLGNVGPTELVVEEIWRLMDRGDPLSWDWEAVMGNMGYDFLIS